MVKIETEFTDFGVVEVALAVMDVDRKHFEEFVDLFMSNILNDDDARVLNNLILERALSNKDILDSF